MSFRRSCFVAVSAALLLSAVTPEASADVPPPAGLKRVGFSFSVKGLASAPDRVLFAYPCGTSNGAPIIEHVKIEEGASVAVGRRGGGCPIYSIAKTAYETWAKDYKPTHTMEDPALQTLASQAMKCTGGPTPMFELSTSDGRGSIAQTLTVKTLDATACVLNAEPIASSPSTESPASTASPPKSPASTGSSPKSSSCSFARGTTTDDVGCALVLACVSGVLAARRRRGEADRSSGPRRS
jgi:hypothetical protein